MRQLRCGTLCRIKLELAVLAVYAWMIYDWRSVMVGGVWRKRIKERGCIRTEADMNGHLVN